MLLKGEPQTYLKSASGESTVLNIWFSIHENAGKQVKNGIRLQFGSYCMICIFSLIGECCHIVQFRWIVLKRASAILYLLSVISVK